MEEITTEVIEVASSFETPSFLIGFLLISVTVLIVFATIGMFFSKNKAINNLSTFGMLILNLTTAIVSCFGIEASFFPQKFVSLIFMVAGLAPVGLFVAKKINVTITKILIASSSILGISFLLFFR